MKLNKIKTKYLLAELNKRDLTKFDKVLISYKNGEALKNIKKIYGSYGIEIIIQNLNMNKISIPKDLWELYLD